MVGLVLWFWVGFVDGGSERTQGSGRAKELPVSVAACIGAGGSTVYLIAVYLGFVTRDERSRIRLLAHFHAEWPGTIASVLHAAAMTLFYIGGGGFVAYVFQLPEKDLAPIQAFILGCTWPAVLGNYLSSRQVGDRLAPEAEKAVAEISQQLSEAEALGGLAPRVEDLARGVSEARHVSEERLAELLNELERRPSRPSPP